MWLEDITNPLKYIECVIAFDVRDWSEDKRLAVIYAIVFGWGKEDGIYDCWPEVQKRFGWSDEGVKRLKKFHEKWQRWSEEE